MDFGSIVGSDYYGMVWLQVIAGAFCLAPKAGRTAVPFWGKINSNFMQFDLQTGPRF